MVEQGYGTVFKISPQGKLTTLHTFDGSDGGGPLGALLLAPDGSFYGTTGGLGQGCCGTIFKLTPGGSLSTVHNFSGVDGLTPLALIQSTDGNLYGTTIGGGLSSLCVAGCGTIFKMTPSGTFTTLYSFSGTDGYWPWTLTQGSDGNFYGTTFYGGPDYGPIVSFGYGTVFKITSAGTLTTLYNFCSQGGCTDGVFPQAGLLQATDGVFYGAASGGGGGHGDIYSLSMGLGPFVKTQHTSGKVGAVVEILGTDLTGATGVTFNGTPSPFKVEASSLIVTTVPTGATTGTIQVVTPSGTLSSYPPFRVVP